MDGMPPPLLTAAALKEIMTAPRARIDVALDRATQFPAGCPPRLAEAIRYCLLAPGKRLRPMLVLWGAEACGSSLDAAMPAACAVEMLHTYSLVHDDLPAMDDDDLRRGRPTCHKVYGEANAILVGDALQALAFETIARGVQPAETAVACVAALAEAAGATALVGGQADDLGAGELGAGDWGLGAGETEFSRSPLQKDAVAKLEAIHRRKTGAMFVVSMRLGGLIAGAPPSRQAALEEYGRKLGLAFQIADDLLDVEGSEAAAGKRVGKDSGHGKLTFPSVLGVKESRHRAERLIEEACAALAPLGDAADRLEGLARLVLERQ
jgi:geranylgeranyl diphosphate synthase, type II